MKRILCFLFKHRVVRVEFHNNPMNLSTKLGKTGLYCERCGLGRWGTRDFATTVELVTCGRTVREEERLY
jgi:hypothetical protein